MVEEVNTSKVLLNLEKCLVLQTHSVCFWFRTNKVFVTTAEPLFRCDISTDWCFSTCQEKWKVCGHRQGQEPRRKWKGLLFGGRESSCLSYFLKNFPFKRKTFSQSAHGQTCVLQPCWSKWRDASSNRPFAKGWFDRRPSGTRWTLMTESSENNWKRELKRKVPPGMKPQWTDKKESVSECQSQICKCQANETQWQWPGKDFGQECFVNSSLCVEQNRNFPLPVPAPPYSCHPVANNQQTFQRVLQNVHIQPETLFVIFLWTKSLEFSQRHERCG